MRREVARDLSDSARAFKELVWPAVADWCGGGFIVPMENVADSRFARAVDVYSGIDAWQFCPSLRAMRGIASRVQWGCAYPTFTVRLTRWTGEETEVSKCFRRLAQEHDGWLGPSLVVQGYVSSRESGRLLYAAACYADDLYRLLKDGVPQLDYECRTNRNDGNEFYVVRVGRMQKLGLEVGEFESRDVPTTATLEAA